MKVTNEIEVYELDGKETNAKAREMMIVTNHWNLRAMVVIVVGDHKYTVPASELERAIRNATNVK